MSLKKIILLVTFLPALAVAQLSKQFPMVPGVPIVHSPKSSGKYIGTPSIVKMPGGDFIASHDFFGPSCKSDIVHVYRSSDKGKNWHFLSEVDDTFWAGLFNINDTLYLLGVKGSNRNLAIRKSYDEGKTWTQASILKEGHYHGSSTPVVFAGGRVYKGYDHLGKDTGKRWMSGNRSFVMSAPVASDLTDPDNWLYSDEIVKPASMDGTGWLETNAVMGPDGKIKGITRVANESGLIAGYYSLINDTTVDITSIGTINFLGGATKFNIRWDEKTKRYWSLANYPPDVLRKPKMRAGGMRSVLALISSENLKDWKLNAIILASDNVTYHGFQYVDWLFDGEDIIVACRTGYEDGMGGSDNAHNSNYMTFHRIKNYKSAKTPKKFRYLLENK
ncbi:MULTISPECIES: sialidase family protein [Bacteroidales]|jgi:hypothetical protein|uniref:sialidase family protein n=1 Tax=Bacteroidales TaxID=171549 RepID=UPI00069440B8|nr:MULTISPECIES: sialidase family protein [Bacteroidales]